MCSAYDSKENIEEAFKSGISEILPKPIKSSQLKYIIEKYI
jgi:CheY-like chemotaxis protein